MKYIDPVGAQGPANAYGFDYVDKNAGAGIAGSFLPADVPEHVQIEILNVIAAAGLTPTGSELDQLLKALRLLFPRIQTGNIAMYARPDGSDNNDGLTNTAARAFRTLQGAYTAIVTRYAPGNVSFDVLIQPGSYYGVTASYGAAHSVTFRGSTGSPADVVISAADNGAAQHAISVYGHRTVSFESIQIDAGTGKYGVVTGTFGRCDLKNIRHGTVGPAQLAARGNSMIVCGGNHTITGGATIFADARESGAAISFINALVAIVGNPYFDELVHADSGGLISSLGTAWSGTQTGKKFSVLAGGIISTNGGGINLFPGAVAGVKAADGVYN